MISSVRGPGPGRSYPFTAVGPGMVLGMALATFVVPGCAAFLATPTVDIVGVELVSLGITSGTVAVVLDVTNEGSRDLNVLGLLYDVEVRGTEGEDAWTRLVGGEHSEEIVIPGKETQRVRVPVPFDYRALGAALQSFLSRGEVPYRLQGKVSVRGFGTRFQVPYRAEGIIQP